MVFLDKNIKLFQKHKVMYKFLNMDLNVSHLFILFFLTSFISMNISIACKAMISKLVSNAVVLIMQFQKLKMSKISNTTSLANVVQLPLFNVSLIIYHYLQNQFAIQYHSILSPNPLQLIKCKSHYLRSHFSANILNSVLSSIIGLTF